MIKLPDELENRFIQLSEEIDKNTWIIGDLTNELVLAYNTTVDEKEVREEIANLIGRAPETIRDYMWMSRVIPAQERVYNLSRHQYRACLGAGDLWKVYAEQAAIYPDSHGGKRAPVLLIRSWVEAAKEEPDWKALWDKIVKAAYKINTNDLPEKVDEIIQNILEIDHVGVD